MVSLLDNVIRLDDAFSQDPHALYAQLRTTGPARRVVMSTGVNVWLVTDYAEARAALSDPTLSKDVSRAGELMERHMEPGANRTPFDSSLSAHMLNTDPPNHTRLRKLVNKAFTARGIDHLRPRVQEISDDLLDKMAGLDEVDLLEAFAFPLPITVICEVLGVPGTDRDDFRSWTEVLMSNDRTERIFTAAASMQQYLVGLIEAKRAEPGNDLLSELVQASDDDDRLTGDELVSMAFLLLVAGHETTVNLIGNGMLALLENPDQLAALRADFSLLPNAIEELLRHEGPVGMATFRYTTQPLTLGDTEIPADEFVVVGLSAANRDPARFPDADRLDITRDPVGHLAFGHGIHYCVGAPLARLEGEIAIRSLLTRFPDLALAEAAHTLRWRDSMVIRGLENLRVRLG
ncbi:cytochrome P450 family protein [Actinokineospora sp. HUAS TT18]|uniref:cytochrome P450 family protein n=1 Tax=Actinokineospora sp. HUAS TT18 TaxID=3447451 RepID=UPI003F520155